MSEEQIKILFLSLLADITGLNEISHPLNENSTVRDIIKELIINLGVEFKNIIFDSTGFLNKYILLSLNGKDIRHYNDLETILQDGDEIIFLPAIAGG